MKVPRLSVCFFSLALLLLSPIAVNAQNPAQAADLAALRAQLDALRTDYQTRIQALEQRLQAIQSQMAGTPAAAPAPAPVSAIAGQAVTGGSVSNAKVFNPDISVIGNFIGVAGRNKVDPEPAMEMRESEVAFQAIVDPYAKADFYLSFGEEGVGLEEGYLTFPAVPGGFLVKVGKMRAAFGKVNTLHRHALQWADRPLITKNLVGGEDGIDDAGFSVARLIPNPFLFLEATAQVYRGDSGDNLFKSSQRGDLSYVGHLRAYKDITDNTNLDLGFSYSRGHNASGLVGDVDRGRFTTRLYGGDATIRWKPLQRSVYHSFVGRSEFVWSQRQQPGGLQDAKGYFVSGDYQLARRWYAGARYDRTGRPDNPSLVDKGQSVILSYWPSEFSQIRAQYRRTNYADGPRADELLMQFQFAIGAHGAHPF